MVDRKINISAYRGEPPGAENVSRKIAGGPLYAQEWIHELLEQGGVAIAAWTRKCSSDVKKLGMDTDDLLTLFRTGIPSGTFIDSEWCRNKPGGPWAACDSYKVSVREYMEAAQKTMTFDYYVKFAISRTDTLLIVSCHLSETW